MNYHDANSNVKKLHIFYIFKQKKTIQKKVNFETVTSPTL